MSSVFGIYVSVMARDLFSYVVVTLSDGMEVIWGYKSYALIDLSVVL